MKPGGLRFAAIATLVMFLFASAPASGHVEAETAHPWSQAHDDVVYWFTLAQDLGNGDAMASLPGPAADLATLLGLVGDDARDLRANLDPTFAYALAWLVTAQQQSWEPQDVARLAMDLLPALAIPAAEAWGRCYPGGTGVEEKVLCLGDNNRNRESFDGGDWAGFGGPGTIYIDGGGDDDYTSETPGFGSAADNGGVGIFIDQRGDDKYLGNIDSFGSNGGIFLDLSGDDTYEDGHNAPGQTTASDSFGAWRGVFIDREGNDTYEGRRQAFGYNGGWFIDEAGWDTYGESAVGRLYNAFGAVSRGVFIDRHGDDQYYSKSSSFGDGGAFIDLRGNDTYAGFEGNFGTGRGGVFVDGDGDDAYALDRPAPVQQFHPRVSAFGGDGGVFADLRGDDTYQTQHPGFGTRGGVFFDVRGDDTYSAGERSFGYFTPSLFADLEGDDVYFAMDTSFAYGTGTFIDASGDDTYAAPGGQSFGYGRTDAGDALAVATVASVPAFSMSHTAHGTNGGFYDLGGDDDYTAGPESFSGHAQGIFYDSENPAGAQGDPMNHKFLVAGAPTEVPEISSPFPGAFAALDARQTLTATSAPTTLIPGAIGTFTVTVEADYPHDVEAIGLGGQWPSSRDTQGPYAPGEHTLNAGFSFTEEGFHFVRFSVTDPAGLHELGRLTVGPVYVDATPPQLRTSFSDGAGGNVITQFHSETTGGLTVEAFDEVSGVEAIFVAVNGPLDIENDTPAWTGTPTRQQWEQTLLPLSDARLVEGVNTILYAAVDAAGNAATGQTELRIDRTAPTYELDLSGATLGNQGWYLGSPTVTLTMLDAHAGPKSAVATWIGPEGMATVGGDGAVMRIDPGTMVDGQHRMDLRVEDMAHAANVANYPAALALKIDATAPITSMDLPTDAESGVTLTIEAEETGSGMNATFYRAWKDQAPARFTVGDQVTLPEGGSWTIEHYGVDVAGNVGDVVTETIDVSYRPPEASFTYTPGPHYATDVIAFEDTSTDVDGVIASRLWDFGDGTTSTDAEPSHAYAEDGTYTVSLTVTDSQDLSATHTAQIIALNRAPVAVITMPEGSIWHEEPVTFTSASTDADGQIVATEWILDGQAPVPGESFEAAMAQGSHTLVLRVTDDDDATGEQTVTFHVSPQPPIIVGFVWDPQEPSAHEQVTLTDVSHAGRGSLASWAWTVDGVAIGTGATLSHTFVEAGSYAVGVTVTHEDGRTAERIHTITVGAVRPVAAFTAPGPALTGADVTFESASHHPDPLRSIDSYLWDFGDGATATTATATHQYADDGTYTVSLTVTDDIGEVAFFEDQVTIQNRAPTAAITAPADALVNTPVALSVAAADADGSIASIQWTIGEATFSGDTLQHTFTDVGTHTVAVTVTDDDGATASDSLEIAVVAQPPTADFSWNPPAPITGAPVTFTDASSDPDDGITTWTWTIQGNTVTSRSATTTFATAGTYTVTLTVTDAHGASHTVEKTVVVAGRAPSASITAPASVQTGEAVAFEDASSDPDGTIASRTWTIDGQTYTTATATHTFTTPGTYTVKLAVTDNDGLTAETEQPIQVNNRKPTVSVDAVQGAVSGTVTLQAQAADPDGTIAKVEWTIGDQTYEGTSIEHTFEPGTYTITVTVTDDLGATSTTVFEQVVGEPEIEETDDVEKESPGIGLLAVLALLGIVAAARRRR